MQDNFDSTGPTPSADSPYIRISRNGSVTHAAIAGDHINGTRERPFAGDRFDGDRGFVDDENIVVRAARPMPKRLSEEVREAAEAERQLREMPPEPTSKPRAARKTKSAKKPEAEQMALPLKTPKERPDSMVKQRQVLGFACIIAAVLVLIALVTYSRDDAGPAETKFSDLPSLFLPHGDAPDPVRDQVRANADQVKNGLGLTGAILANFLINRTIGYAAILYPIFFGAWSLAFFRFTYKQRRRLTLATTFFLITAVLFSATMGTASNFANIPREWFGSVGAFLGLAFTRAIGGAGAFIIYAAAFVIMLVFSIDLDIEKTFIRLRGWWSIAVMWTRRRMIEFWDKREAKQLARAERKAAEETAEAAASAERRDASGERRDASGERRTENGEWKTESGEQNVETNTSAPELSSKEGALSVDTTVLQSSKEPIAKGVEKPSISKRDSFKTPNTVGINKNELIEPEDQASPIRSKTVDAEKREELVSSSKPIAHEVQNIGEQPESGTVIPAFSTLHSPLSTTPIVNPGQPLLKVRPAPKTNGAAIPRMTRSDRDRLGTRSVNFSRLTNGAIPEESTPTPPIESIPALARIAPPAFGPESEQAIVETIAEATPEIEAKEVSNIDSSEVMIEPTRFRAKQLVQEPPLPVIALGDEKVLSNEALPHSVADEHGLPLPEIVPSEARYPKVDTSSDDLFFEEGRKPVIPENPYLEILSKYKNPPLDILSPVDPKDEIDANDEELAKKGRLLRDKLATFGVEIENITVTPGPVVTLYEFTPAEGVKVSRVENLTDDIALAMKARGIRIIAPIPGRGTIGVEIPNDVPKMVRIRSLLESDSFRNTKMNLPLALGKTISGDVYVDDLNRMPHLLIAGATGSGKSVGVNGIIASLLYAKSPRDVKFVIIDPKKIELSLYKKLRKHYLIVSPEAGEDIVTTPAYAVLALKAVEIEMERRYDKLAKAAVRSLADYNIKVAQGKLRSTQDEQHYHLPYIVVVIDELADLMITAAREIEEPICRIAQMARAVGIHLILATQRPSVDVITGVIKANFPARMAFQVATRVDSRTILDSMGAEQLLGNGDMLYQPSGTPKPIRLQSPFISTEEVEAIIDAVAVQEGDKLSYTRPWTLPSLRSKEDGGASFDDEGDSRDDLFEDAARIIVRHQQGSVSLLQRRLKVGYSRAARIVDELEQAGIVGAFDGSKARQVICESEAELEVVLEGLR